MAKRKGTSRKGIGGWKRGARAGNYTAMQWNIACRIKNDFGEDGCSYKDQALISLTGDRGRCATRWGYSKCSGVVGPT